MPACPAINDPGARLVAAAVTAGLPVTVLPGPSAVETALVASGLVADRYQFLGYLPRRARELEALAAQLAGWAHPVVAFDSPRRLPASLAALAREMPARPAAVCRELTKRFEEVVRGTLSELAERFAEPPKGEITLVLGAGSERPREELDADAAGVVAELVAAGVSRRQAVNLVVRLTGTPRNALYRSSL